ncbi:unnamed protein product [Alopecurus aequalis]
MALDSYHYESSCFVLPPPLPGLDWDWELLRCTLGDDDDAARDGIHDALTAMPSLGLESPVSSSSEASSGGGGYLEDAVAHWSDRCKRQKTEGAAAAVEAPPRCPAAMASEDLQCLLQSFWDPSSGEGELLHDLNSRVPGREEPSSFATSEQGDASGREMEQGAPSVEAGQGEGGPPPPFSATGAPPPTRGSSPLQKATTGRGGPPPPFSATGGQRGAPPPAGSSPLQKATTGRGSHYCEPASSSSSSSLQLAGKRDGVLYPFAVVKPLVLDGSTLSDVNRRILKRPARPVRHPVGQFACNPVVSSAHGPGLSGKAVVSLTKIRTGGKGTITIIRTRG